MLGRVIAGVLSTVLLAVSASAQCDYRAQFSGEYRASVFDITIDNNDLWTASGYGVQLFDRSIDAPRLIATAGVPGITRVIRESNGVAYAGGTSGISVLRRTGNSLQLVRTIPTGVVSDLLLISGTLFAATPTGIVEFDLLNRENPNPTGAAFATSKLSVMSLALIGSTLYGADGDSSIEAFSIAVPASPQKIGTLTSLLARASKVGAIGSRLYVSDGISTEVFASAGSSLTSLGTFPFAMAAIADAGSNVIFIAGNDRQLHALDVLVPQNYVELFTSELAPTAGTVNRIAALQTAGGHLYVGGGDSGLATYDISSFASPFPLRAYATGATSSIVIAPDAVYAGRSDTGIQIMSRSASGSLVVQKTFSNGNNETVLDTSNGFLLSSTGPTLEFWTVKADPPQLITSSSFRAPIVNAFFSNLTAIVLLSDGTLWTADLTQLNPAPVRVASTFSSLVQLAHSTHATAATEISADGTTTTVHFWSADLNAPPVDTTVQGASTALAVSDTLAAVFTFRGITVVGATGGLLPGSNTVVIRALQISHNQVIALSESSTVRIWDIDDRLSSAPPYQVPGSAVAMSAAQDSTVVAIATTAGVATIDYFTRTSVPLAIAQTDTNTYYKKAAATATRLYLFDGRVIDAFELGSSTGPRWIWSVTALGVVDFAASDSMLFTLSSNQSVNEYSAAGSLLRSSSLNAGSDASPLSIDAVAGAPWVSFSRGCTTTGCEKRTNVLDPQSLVSTASFAGGVIDVTMNGSRAYAIFDLPVETRIYNVTDTLHPSPLVTSATDVNAVAISYNSGTVYLLADKVYGYSESSLTRTSAQLAAVSPAATADLVIDAGCATIAGRSTFAETYVVPQWSAASGIAVPGSIRTLALAGGRLVILTDYSIEIWSRTTATKSPKRHAVAP